ncbi:MAG: gliding motility-associated C-terminal domain-containing protein [Prevotellaceae bacterium]|jgi:gliding motility-associated-like protein|nr:gliding motility-associated C-terminal domain-containing protein [Prevotellaceae bacterium]
MKYVSIISLFIVCLRANILVAQCDFDIQASVVQHANCMSNGIVEVKVNGSNIKMLSITLAGGAIMEYSNTNGEQFMGLPPNDYLVTVNLTCNNDQTATKTMSLTVDDQYEEMVAFVDGYKSGSLNCMSSGMIPISIRDGSPPYTVTVTGAPTAYTGATSFDVPYPQVMELDSLPEGNYSFTITDACGYSLPAAGSINKVNADFPDNVFDMNFYPSECRKAYIHAWEVSAASDIAYYWNYHRSEYFEIACSFDGNKNWMEMNNYAAQYIDLPDLYRNLQEQNKTAQIYIRIKGTNCEKYIGEAGFPATMYFSDWIEKQCANFKWNVNLDGHRSVICFPYKVEVFDDASNKVFELNNQNDNYILVENLLYNKNYTMILTDSENQQFTHTTVQQNYEMEIYEEHPFSGCDSHGYYIHFNRACFPIKWELYHNGTLVNSADNINDHENRIDGMEYGKDYTLVFTDAGGATLSRDIIDPAGPPAGQMGVTIIAERCDSYDATIIPSNFCPPFDFEIVDDGGLTVTEIDGVGDLQGQTLTGLEYDRVYDINIVDNRGQDINFKLSHSRRPMVIPDSECWDSQLECFNYTFRFALDPYNMYCYPYKWEMFDEAGNLVASESGFETVQEHLVQLEYNKTYRLLVTDASGKTAERTHIYRGSDTSNPSYSVDSYRNYCDNTGYIQIYGSLDVGTRIRFIDGPQTPIHADTTLTENMWAVYPFSEDLPNGIFTAIADGTYRFEIIDKCGTVHPYSVVVRNPITVNNFAYTLQETCEGITRLYPTGLIYDNGNPTTTVYKLEHPNGSTNWHYYYSGFNEYFVLSTSGTYRLTINYGHENCTIEEQVFEYEKQNFTLEGRSSYVCEMNSGQGNIHVMARHGKPPYTYELLNIDNSPTGIPANTTGEFNFGAYGDKYIVRITDACGKSFPVEVYINTLDNIPLVSGVPTVCNDGKIDLKCIFIGAQSYEWTGPRGTYSDRNLTIDNVDETYSGKYKIRVKPAGCNLFIEDSIDINIHTTPAPDIADTFNLCQGEPDKILSAVPLPNHTIKWYDDAGTQLAGNPQISAAVAGESVYFVEQTDNAQGCSTRRTVHAIVHPIVDENVSASGWSCPQGNPQISISGAIEGFSYRLYGNSALTDTIIEFRGVATDPMTLTLPRTVDNSSVFYIGPGADGCRAKNIVSAVNVTVDEITIEPQSLPIYLHNTPYSVQLSTNAIPAFSYTGSMVTGISLSTDGLLSGTVPESAGRETAEFTVSVSDQKGCAATRTYRLQTCEPAPATRDTAYCLGAAAVPLTAVPSRVFPLIWYDENMQQLPSAPTPNTAVAGVQTFYVSQVNTEINCESPAAEIRVTVVAPPDTIFQASADNVCFDSATNIRLNNIERNYQYLIFSNPETTDTLASFTGANAGVVAMSENLVANKSYYIKVKDNYGCLSDTYKTVQAEVTILYIEPQTLPIYLHNTPYSVQLSTNAIPAFGYTGSMVTGISLSADGLLSGIVPESAGRETAEFTVEARDQKGCVVTRTYRLQTCEPAPATRDTAYCLGAAAVPLTAVSENFLPLKWYDENMQQLPSAPTPNTETAGVQTFYVSQVNTEINCESPAAEIRVTVMPLPAAAFLATADKVCIHNSTTIHLDSLEMNYQYLIFDSPTSTRDTLATFTGDSVGMVAMNENLDANKSYYIRVSDLNGCLSALYQEARAEVVELYIQPETIPPYRLNEEYEQIFVSNAEEGHFSMSGNLPSEMILSTDGRLSGTVTEPNVYGEFTITVKDKNNCTTGRDYVFAGNLVVPKVFTPNGDGVNDVFMPSYRLIIYDRLGVEIYSGAEGWDGTVKGQPAPADIYFYKIYYLDQQSGQTKSRTGYVGVER